ncbi:RNA polymerase sigma factor [Lachnospiraceae bacterium]|nr:RNA polymerase sigma factor [Lachnospiraceae bacterium]
MNDREMIREIQRGKKEYLNTIAEKYYDDIYRFCCYQTGNREDAWDLAQETFLHFIRYVEQYHYKNLKGYLLTIARNVCLDYFRRSQRRNQRETDLSSGMELAGKETLSFRTRQEEVIVSVEELSRQLPAMQREAVILYYGYGYKYREIARMTGVGLATAKSRVRQATEKLRRMAEKEELCEE